MATVAIAIIIFFRKKGYIGGKDSSSNEEHALESKLKQMDRADHKKRRKQRPPTNR
jgi:hypothetical protein